MVNYACAFSQSELGEYFEWIIIWNNYPLRLCEQSKIIIKMEIWRGLVNHRCSTVMSYQINLSN